MEGTEEVFWSPFPLFRGKILCVHRPSMCVCMCVSCSTNDITHMIPTYFINLTIYFENISPLIYIISLKICNGCLLFHYRKVQKCSLAADIYLVFLHFFVPDLLICLYIT